MEAGLGVGAEGVNIPGPKLEKLHAVTATASARAHLLDDFLGAVLAAGAIVLDELWGV